MQDPPFLYPAACSFHFIAFQYSRFILQPGEIGPHRASHQHILLLGHGQAVMVKEPGQQFLKPHALPTEGTDGPGNILHRPFVSLGQRPDVRRGRGMGGNEKVPLHLPHLIQRLQIGLHIIEKGNAVLFQCALPGQAIGQKHRAVRRLIAHHVKEVAGQGNDLHLPGKIRVVKPHRLTPLGHQKLMPQVPVGIAPVEKGRLQHRPAGEGPLYTSGKHRTAILILEIPAPADMVGVGVCHHDPLQAPPLLLQQLPHPPAGVLVSAAVDQIDFPQPRLINTDFGGTLQIKGLLSRLPQFIHSLFLPPGPLTFFHR